MKKLITIIAALSAVLMMTCCTHKKDAPKVLVLYYSQTDNSKAVAEAIADALDADIEEIQAVEPYDGNFEETIQRCLAERESGSLPAIQPVKADVQAYDIVFLGFPVWFGTCARPMLSYLSGADLSGLKVVPFCTFGSGGLSSSAAEIAALQPNAEVLPGYGVRAARMDAVPGELDRFLKQSGFLEGEYVKLDEFPEAHEASEDEGAILDAAIADYQMLSAKASTVASRAIPGGTEYLFTALPLPRDHSPAPMFGEMKIYVTVLDGQAPVFTQVVR